MKKKGLFGLASSAILGGMLLFGVSGVSAHQDPYARSHIKLNLNGVNVSDSTAHLEGKIVYVSVDTFADHYGAVYSWNKQHNQLLLNKKPVTNEYGKPKKEYGVTVAPIQALAETLGDADKKKEGHYETGYNSTTKTENVSILPKGFMEMDGHFAVPNMGEHWMNPANPVAGPIWGTYKGKLVFLEYMPDNNLDHDITLNGTQGLPHPSLIDHVVINWNPNGHPGDLNPHHDVHLYFISVAEQAKIK